MPYATTPDTSWDRTWTDSTYKYESKGGQLYREPIKLASTPKIIPTTPKVITDPYGTTESGSAYMGVQPYLTEAQKGIQSLLGTKYTAPGITVPGVTGGGGGNFNITEPSVYQPNVNINFKNLTTPTISTPNANLNFTDFTLPEIGVPNVDYEFSKGTLPDLTQMKAEAKRAAEQGPAGAADLAAARTGAEEMKRIAGEYRTYVDERVTGIEAGLGRMAEQATQQTEAALARMGLGTNALRAAGERRALGTQLTSSMLEAQGTIGALKMEAADKAKQAMESYTNAYINIASQQTSAYESYWNMLRGVAQTELQMYQSQWQKEQGEAGIQIEGESLKLQAKQAEMQKFQLQTQKEQAEAELRLKEQGLITDAERARLDAYQLESQRELAQQGLLLQGEELKMKGSATQAELRLAAQRAKGELSVQRGGQALQASIAQANLQLQAQELQANLQMKVQQLNQDAQMKYIESYLSLAKAQGSIYEAYWNIENQKAAIGSQQKSKGIGYTYVDKNARQRKPVKVASKQQGTDLGASQTWQDISSKIYGKTYKKKS